MHERKTIMYDRSDAFIALPGGLGTFDELFEVATWAKLGLHNKPIIVLNIKGYFSRFLALLEHSVAEGFVPASQMAKIHVVNEIADVHGLLGLP
jgi:TIGR00730 family protein